MTKLTDDELNVMSEQVVESYPCEMIRQIRDLQNQTASIAMITAYDDAVDIIINNTTWE